MFFNRGNDHSAEEEVKIEQEELKEELKGNFSWDSFKKGTWFEGLLKQLLSKLADSIDADYVNSKYPGVDPANQANKIIDYAKWAAGIAGGASAAVISGLQVATPVAAPATVPAMGTALMGDITYTTYVQLRAAYELSVVYGHPFRSNDVEDCYSFFMIAMGVRLGETSGQFVKYVGPEVVKFNMRRLLRTGLRKTLQDILTKLIGSKLGRKLTERALLRLGVPLVSVPVSIYMNRYFTGKVLKTSHAFIRGRGEVARSLKKFEDEGVVIPPIEILRNLVVFVSRSSDKPDEWAQGHLDGLRFTSTYFELADEELKVLDGAFEESLESLKERLDSLKEEGQYLFLKFFASVLSLDMEEAAHAQAIPNFQYLFAHIQKVDDMHIIELLEESKRRIVG